MNHHRTLRSRAGALALLVGACAFAWSGAATAQEKYAVAVFHFNVQYVAGGMVGFSFLPNPELDQDAAAVEDAIVTESFAPVLDLYEKHPTWGVDLEMQGYFLDVLAARHPAVLDKLRQLAKSGQVDVVSFHYSDQLFIGFPAEDWKRSQALTKATFAQHDIPLSRTVFCQEGQAGEALAARMAELGYRNLVWPKNLWSFQHGDADAAPLYDFGGVFLIQGGKGGAWTQGGLDLSLTWTFMDDGELLATGDMNPYLLDVFQHKPEAVKQYEDELLALEAQGYSMVTVDQYVDAVKDKVTHADPPPLLDGTWQPNSTTAVFRWMGGKGLWPGEHDNEVRTLNALAHRELTAAETAAKAAGVQARAELDAAWRLLFLAEVTDASGINPFRGELEYGIAHSTEALRVAREVIRRAKDELGEREVVIDPLSDSVIAGTEADLRGPVGTAPFELVVDAGDHPLETIWEDVAPGHRRVELRFGAGDATTIQVTFPGQLDDALVTTRALDDEQLATYQRSDFTFASFHLALPTGMVSLGPGLFLVKDQGFVHLAAKITRDSGEIELRDQTVMPGESVSWVFHVVEGDAAAALDVARRVNVARKVAR